MQIVYLGGYLYTNGEEMKGKINRLIASWRKGTVRTSASLRAEGYSDSLIAKYVNSKWIEPIGFGAYKLYNDRIDWYGALYALQTEQKSSIHVGGKSALQLMGLAHNIPGKLKKIELYHNDAKVLPKWFLEYKWSVELSITKTGKCGDANRFFTEIELDGINIKTAVAELAILELLLKVPEEESYNEANLIMGGLLNLRPRFLTDVLMECKSIKAKRLFLYLSEKHNQAWLRGIDISKVNLGKGKRQIVTNGMFDAKYLITVPKG